MKIELILVREHNVGVFWSLALQLAAEDAERRLKERFEPQIRGPEDCAEAYEWIRDHSPHFIRCEGRDVGLVGIRDNRMSVPAILDGTEVSGLAREVFLMILLGEYRRPA